MREGPAIAGPSPYEQNSIACLAAGATLVFRNTSEDHLDVHAATTPGDLAAAGADGSATHELKLLGVEWLENTPGGIGHASRKSPGPPALQWQTSAMIPSDVIARNHEHKAHRAGWLRAAVLGANDGLVSTGSLMVGVAATNAAPSMIVAAGVAAVAAGAMSMAAGEYVSVSAQTDIEEADMRIEAEHLAADPEGELAELTGIYIGRGVPEALARDVAEALMEHDALGTHLREELGHHEVSKARPLQAAVASAAAFTAGGLIPFLGGLWPEAMRVQGVWIVTFVGLIAAGVLSAKAAGCGVFRPTLRVVLGGTLAMVVTYAVGAWFGTLGI